jgi:predicted RND superfamily exporter protein
MSEDAQKYLIPLLIALVFLIYILVVMLFRDWIFPIYLVVPLLCGLAVMMGPLCYYTMSFKDVVDYNAQQFISLCLGVGIDANVYLLFRYFEEMAKSKDAAAAMERAWTTTGKAVLYSALSLSLAYIPLCFVKTFWAYLGWGSLMILLLNSFASLVILPTILGVFRPKFLFRSDIKIVQT